MKTLAFRLKPGQDLKTEIEATAKLNGFKAAYVITCVGGLKQATLRMAGATPEAQDIRTVTQNYEIVSLVGTIGPHGSHLHLAIADKEGDVVGGHLKSGTIVHPTAEIVLGEVEGSTFSRRIDKETGFKELVVEKQ